MHKFFKKYLFAILFIIFILFIFHSWFTFGVIAGGDLDYFWNYSFFTVHPYAWNFPKGDGLGVFYVPFLWVYMSESIPIVFFGQLLRLPWNIVERLIFFYPFLICTSIAPIILYKKLIAKNHFYYFAAIIYVTNTYILNIVQGGQMIFALAYSLVPITIVLFIDLISTRTLKKSIILGLILALQLLLDIRVAYIVFVAVCIYFCMFAIISKGKLRDILYIIIFVFIIPGSITVLLHAFWLLPILFYHNNPIQQLGTAYNSLQSVQFFSFAKFENVVGLLHPNWPENIFGKVYFMRPEFLLLPILAYGSLLFSKKISDKKGENQQVIILFFALLGLVGIFLGKGSQDPFGGFYLWMFSHFPGFVMFRDSTKWYILVALSYSILIPFSISSLYHWIKIKTNGKRYIADGFIVCIILYLIFLIRPAVFGQLQGTFLIHKVPEEYSNLEKYLSYQKGFSRTMWLPAIPPYGYSSSEHPAIAASTFFTISDNKKLLQKFSQNSTRELLQEGAIKYIIVPYDSEETIFVKDNHYNNGINRDYLASLRRINWLHELPGFTKLHVFIFDNTNDHIWSSSKNMHVSYVFNNPTNYTVDIRNVQKGNAIIFSEKYDPYWKLVVKGKEISPKMYHTYFMRFVLPGNISEGKLVYTIQTYVDMGIFVSSSMLFIAGIYISLSFLRRK